MPSIKKHSKQNNKKGKFPFYKRSKKIVLYLTVFLMILFFGTIIALQIPYIQTKLVQKASNILSEAINFPIKVEAVDINWFDTVILKGVSVKDETGNEMINVHDLKLDFEFTSLIGSTINVDVITLTKVNIFLVRYAHDSTLNLTGFIQALKNLSNSKNKQKTAFTIEKIIIKNSFFNFSDQTQDSIVPGRKYEAGNTNDDVLRTSNFVSARSQVLKRFDYYHFSFDSTNVMLSEFKVTEDTIQFNISNLSSCESVETRHVPSLQIKKFNCKFLFTSRSIEFQDLSAYIGKSYISNLLIFQFDTIDDISDFINKVNIVAQFDSTVIHSQDLALFAPYLDHLDESWQISGDFKGKVKRFEVKNVNLFFGKNSYLRGNISFDGLPDFQETFIDLNLENSSIEGRDLKAYFNFENSGFEKIEKFGKIQLKGQFIGFPNDFVSYGSFNTSIGKLVSDINLKIPVHSFNDSTGQSGGRSEEPYYKGHLETYNFHFGELIGYPDIVQMIDMNGTIEGTGFSVENAFFTLDANIQRLGIKNYDYKNISIDAELSKELFVGTLEIKDTNLRLKTTGEIDIRDNRNLFDIYVNLTTANLKPLHFSKQQAFLSTELYLDFKGLDIDEIVGSAKFENIYISNNNRAINIDFLSLLSIKDSLIEKQVVDGVIHERTQHARSLLLTSDLMTIHTAGNFDFSQLSKDLIRLWNEYKLYFENNDSITTAYYTFLKAGSLKAGSRDPAFNDPAFKNKANKNITSKKYSLQFNIDIKNINPLLSIIFPDLYISINSKLEGSFTYGNTSILSVNSSADTIIYKNNKFYNNEIELSTSKISNDADVLAFGYLFSELQDLQSLPQTKNLVFEGIWSERNINFTFGIKQPNTSNHIDLYGDLTFLKDQLQLVFKSSSFKIQEKEWKFAQNNKILLAGNEIVFDNLAVLFENEIISINGVISDNPSKLLNFNIRNFELQNINPVIFKQLSGIVNVSLQFKDLYHDIKAFNKFTIDEFNIEKFLIGDVEGFLNWDNISKNLDIDINVKRLNNKIVNIDGYYNPADSTNKLNLTAYLNNANLQIFEPFLSYIVSDISGIASGQFKISGTLNNPVFNGNVIVENGKFKANSMNTKYHFSDKIYFEQYENNPSLSYTKGAVTAQSSNFIGKSFTQQIFFKDLQLYDENNNTAIINGGIFHNGFRDFAIDMRGEFTNFMIFDLEAKNNDLYYGTAIATGDFEMLGVIDDLIITSNAKSNKGTMIYIPLDSYEGVEEQDFIKFVNHHSPLTTHQSPITNHQSPITINQSLNEEQNDFSGIMFDLNLELNTDAYFEMIYDLRAGDIIRGYGNGKLKLEIDTRGDFNMYGIYKIDKGAYNFTLKNLINKEFDILPNSTITWNGDPYDGILNIAATYEQNVSLLPIITDTSSTARSLPEVRRRYPAVVNMNMKGNLMSPQIDFDIDIKDYPKFIKNPNGPDVLLEEDVLRFESYIQSDEQELNKQVFSLLILNQLSPEGLFSGMKNYAGNSVSELVSNQLSYWMSQVDENLEIDIDLSGLDENAFNTFKLRLTYTMLDGRLRITREGSFTNVKNKADLSSIAGEWTVEYLISEDGQFRVKMYNKNNPNSVQSNLENATSTSAGFSLLHTKNFNSLKELFKGE